MELLLWTSVGAAAIASVVGTIWFVAWVIDKFNYDAETIFAWGVVAIFAILLSMIAGAILRKIWLGI